MANKGPRKAKRSTSHFTAVLIVHCIWLTCSVHHSLWRLCRFAYHVLLLPHSYYIMKYHMRWNSRLETCLLCLFHRQWKWHAKDGQRSMRDWRDRLGKLVHQLTVRNQSTKDNVGTLPLFAYTTPDRPPRPLDYSTTGDLTARETVVTNIEQEVVRGAIFIWGQQCCGRQARPHTWIPEQGTLLCWNCRSWCHRQGREFFLWYWVVCFCIWRLSAIYFEWKRTNPPRCYRQ